MTGPQLILHHYDFSNYSEKVRLALGYKGLAWRSVTVPSVAPKPDLTPLTGGYRRTPVLQIGADIYCDTRLILRELERRKPLPSLFPQAYMGHASTIAYWSENQLFRPISLYVSGSNPEVFPLSLQADRARMRGLPAPDAETMRKASERSATLVRAQIPLIETMLADGREFILGQATTIADFAIYHALWFITARTRRLEPELTAYPCILRWMERMRGFGHGRSTAMFPEEALDVAAETSPEPVRTSLPFAEDPRLGDNVRIRADDYGKDIVEGELVLINVDEIALRRQDARVGEIVVHFPRLGYDLRRI